MKYLGVDFGLRRIGLAISEGTLASPWQVLEVSNFQQTVAKVVEIVKKDDFDKVIVGLPEGKIGQTVRGFIKALAKIGLDVEPADETLSSKNALSTMIEQNLPRKKRRFNDAYSAAIILQNYLDQQ